MNIRQFKPEDETAVIKLWVECDLVRPWNDPVKDIDRKLLDSADLFFVAEQDGDIVASVMAGYEGHRGWVNYLAVALHKRRDGLGRILMDHVERVLLERGCPKINLQVRETNKAVLEFYQSIGYKVDAAVSLGKRLIPDDVPDSGKS